MPTNSQIPNLNTFQSFNTAADTYHMNNTIQLELHTAMMRFINTQTFDTILDIGCGSGTLTRKLHHDLKSTLTIGIDKSPNMIEKAVNRTKEKTIHFIVQDAETLSLRNKASFIYSNATIQWITNLDTFFSRLSQLTPFSSAILFSIFLPKTYHELGNALNNNGYPNYKIASQYFYSYDILSSLIPKYLPSIHLETLQFIHTFDSVLDLFKIIKYSGTKPKKPGILLTPKKCKEIDRWFHSHYGHIQATYDVVVGYWEKN